MPPRLAVPRGRLRTRVRNWFLTGLIIAGPLAITAWLVWWFVDTVDHWVKPLIPPQLWPDTYLPVQVPGTGVVLAFVGITLLGFLAANLAGRTLIRLGEMVLDRMPIVRGIYKSAKQIFETIFSPHGTSFRRVGLIQFPAKGMWSLVYISSPPSPGLARAIPGDQVYTSVFMPCSPNPTAGFYFYLPASEVVEVALTPEQAVKIVMSAGLIQPDLPAVLGVKAETATHEQKSADPALSF
jgi:uncharacterized membrane protein